MSRLEAGNGRRERPSCVRCNLCAPAVAQHESLDLATGRARENVHEVHDARLRVGRKSRLDVLLKLGYEGVGGVRSGLQGY